MWRQKAKLETSIYTNVYKDTTNRLYGIWNLLLRWKCSVFRLIWHDLVVFLVAYSALSILYRVVLFEHEPYRQGFEIFCIYAGRFSNLIPISFLTGFYVNQVVNRWWDEFMSLPWPDKIAFRLVSYIPGKDSFRKNLRRTVIRYINLSTILVYRLVSLRVQQRFPTYDTLIDARVILPHEVKRLQAIEMKSPHEYTWVPLLWACKLIQRARTEGKVVIEPPVYANLISSFDYVEGCNRKILNYGWVNFPLAYTQVASVSVFVYFLAALFGRQFLEPQPAHRDNATFPNISISSSIHASPFESHTPDFYIPFFTIIEFLSYMGWIKVAETLLNPFGDDDEDFEINYIIDRNLQTSYLIVDEAEEEMEMADDPFLEAGITVPQDLPEYKVLGRRKSGFKNSIKIKHLKVPSLSVETPKIARHTTEKDNNLETLIQNGRGTDEGSITYRTVNEEPAMGSEATGTPRSRKSLSSTAAEEAWSLEERAGTPRPGRLNKNFVAEGDAASDKGN